MDARELIFELHKRDGGPGLSKLPGLWERKLNDRWTIWINGLMEELTPRPGMCPIGPGEVYVEFNGWPAGLFSLITGEGEIAAGGLANYDTFCTALQSAIERGPERKGIYADA